MSEPTLKYCTVREGDDEWHLECRFSDGQKYAAIKLDGACPQLASRVAALLNGNVWTDERPSEPGEYWVSIAPRHRLRSMGSVVPVVVHEDQDIDPYLAVRSCDGGWVGRVDAAWLDGAKWSRRETPADPFEVTK